MEQRGIISEIRGEYAIVKTRKKISCNERCSACQGCGFSPKMAKVLNEVNARKGDNVLIEMKSGRVLLAALMLYIFPMLLGICVYIGILAVTQNILISQVAGVGIFAAAYITIYILNKKMAKNDCFSGKVTKIFD